VRCHDTSREHIKFLNSGFRKRDGIIRNYFGKKSRKVSQLSGKSSTTFPNITKKSGSQSINPGKGRPKVASLSMHTTLPRKQPDQPVPPPRSFLRRRVSRPDPGPGSSSGNGANPLHDFCFNQVIFETGRFKQEKTGQFSGPAPVAKNRLSAGHPGTCPGPEPRYGRKIKGVPYRGKMTRFSRKIILDRPLVY
jgi:hypothetical protein